MYHSHHTETLNLLLLIHYYISEMTYWSKTYFVLCLLLNFNYFYWANKYFISHGLWTGVFRID